MRIIYKILFFIAVIVFAVSALFILFPNRESKELSQQISQQVPQQISNKVVPEKFSFIVLSDSNGLGNVADQPDVFEEIINEITQISPKPVFVIHNGDMIGGNKNSERKNAQGMWNEFLKTIQPLGEAEIGFFPSAGNHDASYNKVLLEVYKETWGVYKNIKDFNIKGSYNKYYSFDFKNSHFIILFGAKKDLDKEQLDWLNQDLFQAEGKYDNIFVFSHIPLTVISWYHPFDRLEPTNEVKGILKNKITAFFGGHHHLYYDFEEDGIRQIGTGTAGSGDGYYLSKPGLNTGSRGQFSYLKVIVLGKEVKIEQIKK